ncbi:hypothetical protein GZ176_11710 [Dermatophilus congolensis]|uniref:hypothetical protein n=1 Tax=Dermatophilus congolensis TaxID=1863 RepID=UPI001AAE33F1|nr:hypothetical protein [Dermatophilus congolensis]MBO3146349.1 hypothetical protein [Dermatophilus congolensis]MBO3148608.1 hypothetical protein [Dermatophilus congolensis]MBO3157586.1 hypothetical protein [Dermatophilus congolensis]MBO3159866.1 hypothetical protein [Dermatophilus congolensis]MBO3166605.1 hypothetical protein [Dermatophilus congolensis]
MKKRTAKIVASIFLLICAVLCVVMKIEAFSGRMGPSSMQLNILGVVMGVLVVFFATSALNLLKELKNTPFEELSPDEKWIYYGDRASMLLPATLLLIFGSLYQIYENTIREGILYGFNFVLAYSVLMGVVLLWVMIIGSRKKQQKKAS